VSPRCWSCKSPNDCHDGARAEDVPATGDVSLCFYCRRIGIFVETDNGLEIRRPTDEERLEIETRPGVRQALGAMVESYDAHTAVDLWRAATP
jgi:hypothetical protein